MRRATSARRYYSTTARPAGTEDGESAVLDLGVVLGGVERDVVDRLRRRRDREGLELFARKGPVEAVVLDPRVLLGDVEGHESHLLDLNDSGRRRQ